MQDKTSEHLSAYVDGELRADERRFLVQRLAADDQAFDQLSRYHTMSAAIRGEYVSGANELTQRISEALTDEPTYQANMTWEKSNRNTFSVVKPLAGMAIAASVALGIVAAYPLVTGLLSQPSSTVDMAENTDAETLTPPTAESFATVNQQGMQRVQQTGGLDAAERHRLNPYFVNHSEHSASGRLGGTLKYVRIVGHDAER